MKEKDIKTIQDAHEFQSEEGACIRKIIGEKYPSHQNVGSTMQALKLYFNAKDNEEVLKKVNALIARQEKLLEEKKNFGGESYE